MSPPRIGRRTTFLTWTTAAALAAVIACRKNSSQGTDAEKPNAEPTSDDESKGFGPKKGPGPPGANLDYFKIVPGCSCRTDLRGKGDEVMNLRLYTGNEKDGELSIGWTIEIPGREALQLEGPSNDGIKASAGRSPPHRITGGALAVGVACSKDIFAVVTSDRVTGWSTKTTRPVWDATLSGRYAGLAPPGKAPVNVVCNAVPTAGQSMQIPLEGGKVQAIDLSTGN